MLLKPYPSSSRPTVYIFESAYDQRIFFSQRKGKEKRGDAEKAYVDAQEEDATEGKTQTEPTPYTVYCIKHMYNTQKLPPPPLLTLFLNSKYILEEKRHKRHPILAGTSDLPIGPVTGRILYLSVNFDILHTCDSVFPHLDR